MSSTCLAVFKCLLYYIMNYKKSPLGIVDSVAPVFIIAKQLIKPRLLFCPCKIFLYGDLSPFLIFIYSI